MTIGSKAQDVKRLELEKALGALPPAVVVSLDSGILILTRVTWRKPRIRRIYDRIGFVGLGPIPSHFSQLHSLLSERAHRVGTMQLGPEDVWCEDLADEASQVFATFFYNDSRDEAHYLFAEVMLAEVALAEREHDYLAYVTYDGKVVEASDARGAILVSGLSWNENGEADEGDRDESELGRGNRMLAKRVLDAFEGLWTPEADPRVFIAKYAELIPNGGILEIGWLDRGMVWLEQFGSVFFRFRGGMPQGLPTMIDRGKPA